MGEAAGGEGTGGGVRAGRKLKRTPSRSRGARSRDGPGERRRIRAGSGGGSGGVCGRGLDAAEDRNRKAGDLRSGEKTDSTRRCDLAGRFGKDDDRVGTGGHAGVAAREEG